MCIYDQYILTLTLSCSLFTSVARAAHYDRELSNLVAKIIFLRMIYSSCKLLLPSLLSTCSVLCIIFSFELYFSVASALLIQAILLMVFCVGVTRTLTPLFVYCSSFFSHKLTVVSVAKTFRRYLRKSISNCGIYLPIKLPRNHCPETKLTIAHSMMETVITTGILIYLQIFYLILSEPCKHLPLQRCVEAVYSTVQPNVQQKPLSVGQDKTWLTDLEVVPSEVTISCRLKEILPFR